MIVAHLSDLHLGFRAYGRVERGIDMRERDVAAAFERAVEEVAGLGPDVVVVAGDVFDRPDPPAGAVVALARGLEALRSSLPATRVLMVAGPRDTPRRPGDPGALAVLDAFPNVEAATGLTRSILIESLSLHTCLVPHRSVMRQPPVLPEPDPRMRWNLLVLHAEVARGSDSGVHVDPSEWDYVALGGEHRRREVGEGISYSGSLERVALDPWDEAADEKGFLTVDLETGRTCFHAVPGRPVVSLAPVRVGPREPERLVRRVLEEVPGGIADKIVHLRLQGAAPADLLALQGEPLRNLRARALHLAVEAGKDLEIPAEAWLSVEAPMLLREAVAAELEQDGVGGPELEKLVAECVPEDIIEPLRPLGVLEALDGDLPGFGRVSTSIPPGLTAVLGGHGRARRAVAELFLKAGRTDPTHDALERLWAGTGAETLERALQGACEAVAESRGLSLVDAALERLGAGVRTSVSAVDRPDRPRRGAVRVDPEQVAAELRVAERELRAIRADVAEVDGDLEVATMDWLRERQDAETTLQAYRDRARELRARVKRLESAGPEAPCPTCGRVLAGHYQEVLSELHELWESVVQDGGWWRSRWEQLELKPEHLRDLEGRSLRLHAALEAGSERVELLRARLGELEGFRREVGGGVTTEPEGAVVSALERVRTARIRRARDMVLDRASRFVCRISGSRILAVTLDENVVQLQETEGVLTPLSEEDVALGRIAIRLAAASLVAAGGRLLASLPIEEPFDRLDDEARVRALALTRQLLKVIPRVILFSRGDAVDARPELFDYVLEVREDGTGSGPLLRPVAAGPGRVALKATVPRNADTVGAR